MLDFLESQGVKPENVHVLVHEPEHADIPDHWRKTADIRAANRSNFLDVAAKVPPDSTTVIAWGHGGDLRGKAVFHVSGPRITPADFKTFVSGKFLLFFTGSGEFAGILATENCEIFASENATRFTNDPIGIDVVLSLWKKQPGITLNQLARAAGVQIASWYTERQLARTEEPTLFVPGKEPLPVAALPSSPDPRMSPSPPFQPTGDLKSISKVSPADFPKADAVILNRSIRYTLGDDLAIDAEIDETTQILTSEGKARGDFAIPFSPPDEDLEFVALEILTPDGRIETFSSDDILENKSDEENATQKRFSLPGVEPGSVLHVHYRRTWRRFPLPHIFLEIPVTDQIPILSASIRVESARDEPLHYHVTDLSSQQPVETTSSYGKIYEWTWGKTDPFKTEYLTEPGGEPRLQISTFSDWKSFADWYRRLIREADTVTPEIRAKAADLIAGKLTPEEKVKAVYKFVTAMRYVSIPLGVNSHRPHAAANVLRNRFGDCKDKANLLNTLLRAVDIDASLVLVPRFTQAHEAVPGLAFNHAISRVKLPDDRVLWLDSTDDVCPFGMLPPGDPGRNVLVVDGSSSRLEMLPNPKPAEHSLTFDISSKSINVSAKGFPGYAFREAARQADAYNETLPLLRVAQFSPVNGIFVTSEESHSHVSDLEGPFHWSAKGRFLGKAPSFFLPDEWRAALQPRTRPLFLNRGYPFTLTQNIRDLPGDRKHRYSEQTTGPLQWRLDGSSLHVTLEKALLDPQQAAEFQQSLLRLLEELN